MEAQRQEAARQESSARRGRATGGRTPGGRATGGGAAGGAASRGRSSGSGSARRGRDGSWRPNARRPRRQASGRSARGRARRRPQDRQEDGRDGKRGFGRSDVSSMRKPPGVKQPRLPLARHHATPVVEHRTSSQAMGAHRPQRRTRPVRGSVGPEDPIQHDLSKWSAKWRSGLTPIPW